MHLLHLCKVRVHEVAEQDLRVEFSPGIRQFDMSHAVDGTFLKDRESGPVVVDVRLENLRWGLWGKAALGALLGRSFLVALLLATTENRR